MSTSFKFITTFISLAIFATSSFGQIKSFKICNLIETEGNKIVDSLKLTGADTIIFYRTNVPQAFSAGTGKIIWKERSVIQVISIELHKGKLLKKTGELKLNFHNPFDYFTTANVDTVTTNPNAGLWRNYDLHHYVYVTLPGKVYSYDMTDIALCLHNNHPRSKLIILLNNKDKICD